MRGSIAHIWMSPDTGRRSRYGARTLGGIAGIVVLAVLWLRSPMRRNRRYGKVTHGGANRRYRGRRH